MRTTLGVAVLGALLLVLAGPASPAEPKDWVVTNYTDSPANPAPGTLRAALKQAGPGDTITFQADPNRPDYTIALKDTLTVGDRVTIDGKVGGSQVTLTDPNVDPTLPTGKAALDVSVETSGVRLRNLGFKQVALTIVGDDVGVDQATFDGRQGAVRIVGDDVTVAHTTFTGDSDYAIAIDNAEKTGLDYDTFKNQSAWSVRANDARKLSILSSTFSGGGGIRLDRVNAPKLDDVTLTSVDTIGVYLLECKQAKVHKVTVLHDASQRTDTRGLLVDGGDATITNLTVGRFVLGVKSSLAGVTIDHSRIKENVKAGIWVDSGDMQLSHDEIADTTSGPGLAVRGHTTMVRSTQTTYGGNAGPGIDLNDDGVTLNNPSTGANGGIDSPTVRFENGKIWGTACASCVIEAYAIETGARKGNPHNGEGVKYENSVTSSDLGAWSWPRTGEISCADAKKLTFTATDRDVAKGRAATSEFSADVKCGTEEPKTRTTSGCRIFLRSVATRVKCTYHYKLTLDVKGTVASEASTNIAWNASSQWHAELPVTFVDDKSNEVVTTTAGAVQTTSGSVDATYSSTPCSVSGLPLSTLVGNNLSIKGTSPQYGFGDKYVAFLPRVAGDYSTPDNRYRPSSPPACADKTAEGLAPYAFAGIDACEWETLTIPLPQYPFRVAVAKLGEATITQPIDFKWRYDHCTALGPGARGGIWDGSITGTLTLARTH